VVLGGGGLGGGGGGGGGCGCWVGCVGVVGGLWGGGGGGGALGGGDTLRKGKSEKIIDKLFTKAPTGP